MRNLKRIGAVLTAIALIFSLNLTAFAAVEDTGFSDVAADAWYADAVEYVRDNGLMSGTSETAFEPEGAMTRGMLVTTLYRIAGSPLWRMKIWDTPMPMCRVTPGTPTGSTGPGWLAPAAGWRESGSGAAPHRRMWLPGWRALG